MDKQDKIAVLIDAENVSKKYIKLIMESLHTNGFTVILQIPVLWHGRMRSEILH